MNLIKVTCFGEPEYVLLRNHQAVATWKQARPGGAS